MRGAAKKIVTTLLEEESGEPSHSSEKRHKLSAEELQEIWEDDQAGEYIQINPDDSVVYVAHGTAKEQIAPPLSKQTVRRAVGIGKFKEEPADANQGFKLIRLWMKKHNYYPNIWQVNDHGNIELYNSNGKALGGLV